MIAKIDERCKGVQPYSSYKKEKHGMCNTVFIPDSSLPVSVFIDWLRFFGKDLQLPLRIEDLIIQEVLAGNLFMVSREIADLPHQEGLEVVTREAHGQIHQGSVATWTRVHQNSAGVRFWVSENSLGFIQAIKLEFSGKPLSELIPRNNSLKLLEIIEYMLSIDSKIKVSRIDTTLEVDKYYLSLENIKKAIEKYDFSGARNRTIICSSLKGGVGDSYTFYVGSRVSRTKIVRIYETQATHGYDKWRIEVQNGGKRALMVVSELMKIYSQLNESLHGCNKKEQLNHVCNEVNQYLKDYILSTKTLNFIDSSSKKKWQDSTQFKPLEWWAEFKKKIKVTNLKYKFSNKEKSIKTTLNWLLKSVSGTLCTLRDAIGEGGFYHFIKHLIKVKKEGVECKKYNNTEDDNWYELIDLGDKAMADMMDNGLKMAMREVGYFKEQLPLRMQDKVPFTMFADYREKPDCYRSNVSF